MLLSWRTLTPQSILSRWRVALSKLIARGRWRTKSAQRSRCHAPRKRSIQYAAAIAILLRAVVTGSPACAGDDTRESTDRALTAPPPAPFGGGMRHPCTSGSKPFTSSPSSPGWRGCSICRGCSSITARPTPGSRQSETFKVMERRLLRVDHQSGDDRDLAARAVARLEGGWFARRLAARQARAGRR